MSQTSELELAKSERENVESEKLRILLKKGVPFIDLAKKVQEQVQQIQKHFGSLEVEAKQFLEPMNNLLKLLQQRVTFLEELKEFGGEITGVTVQLSGVIDHLIAVADNVQATLVKMDGIFRVLTADLAERRVLRLKQMETLQKIDKYLMEWS